ncbi:MAG: DNA repair protein RadC [Chlorobiaceae bacterium]|nr:DNA repair protein RadC [Chlorobiaceae bacterium]
MTKGMCVFRQYSLKLVKEKAAEYDAPKYVKTSGDIERVCREVLGLHEQAEENLVCFDLNSKNAIVAIRVVSVGTINSSLVHPREVFKGALMSNANSVIIAHNHPSGVSEPSASDHIVTRQIWKAGELLQVQLLDHVVIGHDGYYSYLESGFFDQLTTKTKKEKK